MRKFVLVSMVVIAAATSVVASPSFAQSAGKGRDSGHSSSDRSGDWYRGASTFTHYSDNHNKRRPRPILVKSGAYCVERREWVDAWGKLQVAPYRECRDRRHIEID